MAQLRRSAGRRSSAAAPALHDPRESAILRVMSKPEDTPLMQQWRDAKSRHPDALIFMRVGDFYEMFYEDAEEGARLLGLTLTARNNGAAVHVPLAGVPARSRDDYIEKLIRLGRRVAICEQVEDPAEAKGLVRREVTETVTPGAVLSDTLLTERRNNFLLALTEDNGRIAIAAADVSTGELIGAMIDADALEAELARWEPAEILLPTTWEGRDIPGAARASRTYRPAWLFDREFGADELRRRYAVHGIEGFGFQSGEDALVGVLGALLGYLGEVQPVALLALRPPRFERERDAMPLDEMTRRNLELVEPLRIDSNSRANAATLLAAIDETLTPMGARALRRWILRPLLDITAIRARHDAVAELLTETGMRRDVRGSLADVRDLERLAGKVAAGRVSPRELRALATSLQNVPVVQQRLARAVSPLLAQVHGDLDPLDDLAARIDAAIADVPPATLAEGGAIRAGWNTELDELRALRDGATDYIARLQTRERERTGIASLKVGFNKVFGYYLEITHANSARVPADYERKQTLANAERYVTPELKEWEERALDAEERTLSLEVSLFAALRGEVAAELARIQRTAATIATLDVLLGFAQLAERRDYVRPEMHDGFRIEITAGRHPVVETMMPREAFIPNDVILDSDARVMIVTGPNMGGKSTLLRQIGLIQLLAQIGAFVPARAAQLPVCDRIFTRVGASDNLVRGQSTFMVEMHETAAILHNATAHSLILLDEIGRGTATYDGVSIAWGVTEHIHQDTGAKTVFATHYHELTQLSDQLPGVVNFHVAVREVADDIVFLHTLRPGGASRSYGIEVGRLAGLPPAVVTRAREILADLEGAHTGGGEGLGRHGAHAPATAARDQLSLFAPPDHPVIVRLRRTDVDALTPIQALNLLAELRGQVE